MKLKFKHQQYQTNAVNSVVDCFKGQPFLSGFSYRIDPGIGSRDALGNEPIRIDDQGLARHSSAAEDFGFRNEELVISDQQLLENIQQVQRLQNLPQSSELAGTAVSKINLDVEMETGTGKTYCYIKTMFEMNKRYGWNKFIVVVPSIAIREGVYKSISITTDHFQETYHKKAKFFIYNSKQLHNLESFSSDSGINVMVINVQAFAARGKDNRRIYEELDDFQSRRPIDVIKANRPILILDEPQKMEGPQTVKSLQEFNPLMILRYSATHKTKHNKIHRLDALDAYNQKLVKKIAVRGISVKGLAGTHSYLYLESIEISKQAPVARMEIEVKQKVGIKRIIRKLKKGDNLYDLSGEMDQYQQGFVISDINAITDSVSFTNGIEIMAGEATGDVNESTLRRIQIREAIRAHFEKELVLFSKGIKVLTLFFIDEVAKYRVYTKAGEEGGEYAQCFEEEYNDIFQEVLQDILTNANPEYKKYLENIAAENTHNGYFSIDKKTKRLVDPNMTATERRQGEASDVDAYDLILKDKERLLSFEEPTRFVFSHSALREGWDNPNVFVICTLKHSDNVISRRQEVGRGLRIAVDQLGERQDNPVTVHQTNVLTVVASESYQDFVAGLQKDISESLSDRPSLANEAYFTGKLINADDGPIEITSQTAKQIYRYLIKNDYTDDNDYLTDTYHQAVKDGTLATLPEQLEPYQEQIFELIEGVDNKLPTPENDRGIKTNPLNSNFQKKEFQELWKRINQKAAYSVHFDSNELIEKCVKALDKELKVTPLQYSIQRGEQLEEVTDEQIRAGEGFKILENSSEYEKSPVISAVKYDLIGKIASEVLLTRKTITLILSRIRENTYSKFQSNPEQFISEVSRLINEQKATVVIEHLTYDELNETHQMDIFTEAQTKQDFSKAGDPLKRHIYDYVITDSKTERRFVTELDTSSEVVVYAKLPKGFQIPTPVGNYNPDWAICFKEGVLKHIYFVAETKGSMSSMELRTIEKTKIECARKFFKELNKKIVTNEVNYDVVDSYGKLMDIVA